MSEVPTNSLSRSLATLGMAVFGPLTLFSGIGVFGLISGGPPTWLLAVFMFSLAGVGVSTLAYLATDIMERDRE